MLKPPTVIFLDAVGTLFGIKGSVGEIYGEIAADYGVKAPYDALNRAFLKSFKAAPPLAFPDKTETEIVELEYQWWQEVCQNTFTEAGVFDQFSDFNEFFDQLYQHFGTIAPWFIYPDVIPALTKWQERGIQLGVISNFDSRLLKVLDELELSQFFSHVVISATSGAAKPDSQIFQTALKQYNCPPEEAWHIGDSEAEDYQGAKTAGIKAFLLKRS